MNALMEGRLAELTLAPPRIAEIRQRGPPAFRFLGAIKLGLSVADVA